MHHVQWKPWDKNLSSLWTLYKPIICIKLTSGLLQMDTSSLEKWIDFWKIGFNSEDYTIKYIPKKTWGHRALQIPNAELKKLQKRYADFLQTHCQFRQWVSFFSYRKGCSVLDNAKLHLRDEGEVGNTFVIRIDLKDYFQTIDSEKIAQSLFKFLGSDKQHLIERICEVATIHSKDGGRHLSTWSPLSPALSNIVWHYLIDFPILMYLEDIGVKWLKYSRYSDDIIISFPFWFQGLSLMSQKSELIISRVDKILLVRNICEIVERSGFFVNTEKIRFMSPATRQTITWITINSNRPSIQKKVRGEIYFYCNLIKKYGVFATIEKWNKEQWKKYDTTDTDKFIRMLLGKLNWIRMVMGENKGKCQKYFDFLQLNFLK